MLFDVEKPVAWRENLHWESILLKDIHLVVRAEISGSSVLGWVLVHQKAKWFSVEASTNEVSNKNDWSPLMVLRFSVPILAFLIFLYAFLQGLSF